MFRSLERGEFFGARAFYKYLAHWSEATTLLVALPN